MSRNRLDKNIVNHINRNNIRVIRIIKTYSLTDSGKSWRRKPDEVNRSEVDAISYYNFVDASNSFIFTDRIYFSDIEGIGLVVTRITSVSPDRTSKRIITFEFEHR